MNVLVLNTSPKRKGGASRFFSKLLKLMLLGCKITTCDIRNKNDYKQALSALTNADAVVISSPLYVDGIPAHMLPFLMEVQNLCHKNHYQFQLYVLSNNGFVEGKQNMLHLKMYEAWCNRANITWGGGLGIGGGVMLYVLYLLFPISFLIRLLRVMVIIFRTGSITSLEIWHSFARLLVTVFFFIGALICELIFAHAIRHKKQIKNMYTRPLIPSFLFLICADIFMFISALFRGTWPHKLFKKIDRQASVENNKK